MSNRASLSIVTALAASAALFGNAHAATVVQTHAAPPPRAVIVRPPVVRPTVMAHPAMPGKPGAPGAVGARTGAPGGVGGAAANAGGAAANPRAQLMEMVHPAGVKPVPTALHADPAMHGPTMHDPAMHGPVHAAFTRPANIRHNPEHHIGHVGDAHHHAPFMYARGGHHFYRRYYIEGGVWFWYDEPAADDDPDVAAAADLPTCDENADECKGTVVPLASSASSNTASPNGAFAPSDPGPGQ